MSFSAERDVLRNRCTIKGDYCVYVHMWYYKQVVSVCTVAGCTLGFVYDSSYNWVFLFTPESSHNVALRLIPNLGLCPDYYRSRTASLLRFIFTVKSLCNYLANCCIFFVLTAPTRKSSLLRKSFKWTLIFISWLKSPQVKRCQVFPWHSCITKNSWIKWFSS